MLIGLLSDTHIPQAEIELPHELMEAFRGVDLILHAGDIYLPSVLDDLEHIAPVLAATGDDDGDILGDDRVKYKHVLKLEDQTLWLVHQRAYLFSAPHSEWWQKKDSRPDIVVFGHEHNTIVEYVDNTLFVNPGSPTFLKYQHGLGTVGILDISPGKADIHIVHL